MTDIPALLRLLSDNGVQFIVAGGVAGVAHGSVRLTSDLDIVYSRNPENLNALVLTLAPHAPYLRGAPPGLPFRFDLGTLRRGLNFTLQTDLGALDLFGEITGGGSYEQLLPATIILKVFGLECRCINLRRLIEVKRAAGRPRDLEAVAELEILLERQNDPKKPA